MRYNFTNALVQLYGSIVIWNHCIEIDSTTECRQRLNVNKSYKREFKPIIKLFTSLMGPIAFIPEDDVSMALRFLKPLLPVDMAEFSSYYEST